MPDHQLRTANSWWPPADIQLLNIFPLINFINPDLKSHQLIVFNLLFSLNIFQVLLVRIGLSWKSLILQNPPRIIKSNVDGHVFICPLTIKAKKWAAGGEAVWLQINTFDFIADNWYFRVEVQRIISSRFRLVQHGLTLEWLGVVSVHVERSIAHWRFFWVDLIVMLGLPH